MLPRSQDPRHPDHGGRRAGQHLAAGRRRRHRHHHDHRRHPNGRVRSACWWRSVRRDGRFGLFLGEAVALGARRPDGPGPRHRSGTVIHLALPALPVRTPLSFVLLAEAVAIIIGLAAGVLPARRAARLDRWRRCVRSEWQTIHLHRDAPPKPAVGAPCNGCGVCCAAAPCPASLLIFSRRQ